MSLAKATIHPRSFGTHDGTFHADEICACALLLMFDLIDREKIVRTRDLQKLAECEFVCDVGGVLDPTLKRFDHHQVQYQGEKSSAGLILQYLCDTYRISRSEWQMLQEAIIMGVDAHDNGRGNPERGVCTFSHIISNFAPIEYEPSDRDLLEAFYQALDFTLGHLKRLWERNRYYISCRDIVAKVMAQSKDLLVFEQAIPWLDNFFALDGINHPARFVLMPSGRYWKLRAVPPSLSDRMNVRMPLPAAWSGLMDEELAQVSGIPGAVFCHKGRFISVWKNKQSAEMAYEKIIKQEAV